MSRILFACVLVFSVARVGAVVAQETPVVEQEGVSSAALVLDQDQQGDGGRYEIDTDQTDVTPPSCCQSHCHYKCVKKCCVVRRGRRCRVYCTYVWVAVPCTDSHCGTGCGGCSGCQGTDGAASNDGDSSGDATTGPGGTIR